LIGRSVLVDDWRHLGVDELAGQLGVSHHLAPAPVVSMLMGEWTSLLEAGRRLDEVSVSLILYCTILLVSWV
jgi:hypothetical protein